MSKSCILKIYTEFAPTYHKDALRWKAKELSKINIMLTPQDISWLKHFDFFFSHKKILPMEITCFPALQLVYYAQKDKITA